MITRRLMVAGAACGLVACAKPRDPKFKTYDGPKITQINVFKEQRVMQLLSGDELVKSYDIEMGFAPKGHKQVSGDGRTPEGGYRINRRNPNSKFHLSLGISYPNARDVANARALGQSPGGDIFIHGTPKEYIDEPDWTWGCIAVSDAEMEDIYAMVGTGTAIFIVP